ncbi:hypothetical protein [Devosia sp. XK-2]|uniref:hypothetical protein n=1 Tax=Devosia sp. XK-2 TaxID=3126689 RepID=UPI0030CBE7F3
MQIGGDYPKPVMVNGYACHNCDEVSAAKRGEDPSRAAARLDPAVDFGGSLAGRRAMVATIAEPQALVDKYA